MGKHVLSANVFYGQPLVEIKKRWIMDGMTLTDG